MSWEDPPEDDQVFYENWLEDNDLDNNEETYQQFLEAMAEAAEDAAVDAYLHQKEYG